MNKLISTLHEEMLDMLAATARHTSRDVTLPKIEGKIHAIIGMRRVGKTSYTFQLMHHLLTEGVTPEQVLYINFEDDRLLPMDYKKCGELIDAFYTRYPDNHDRITHLFLDEIQNIEDWHLVVRRFFDSKNVKIYLSGSSAKMLSKEIATNLRGRSISTEIWPFSFEEYLSSQKINLPREEAGKKSLDKLRQHLIQYLQKGAFPEIVLQAQDNYHTVLQEYVDVVLYRDIIERHKLKNITLLKYTIKTLLKNIASPCSVNKLHNDLKSQGLSPSKSTLFDYLDYIEDAYMVFAVPLYDESIRKTQVNPRKIYAIDTGLSETYNFGSSERLGHLFENLVYLDLRRRGCEVWYYLTEDRYEVDFIAKYPDRTIKMYQVAWEDTDTKTLEREMRALKHAEKELGFKGQLITMESYLHGEL